jgi:hypothetical protein
MDKAELETGVGIVAALRTAEKQDVGAAILVYRRGKRAIESRSGIWNEPQAEKQRDEQKFRTQAAYPSRIPIRDNEMPLPAACHFQNSQPHLCCIPTAALSASKSCSTMSQAPAEKIHAGVSFRRLNQKSGPSRNRITKSDRFGLFASILVVRFRKTKKDQAVAQGDKPAANDLAFVNSELFGFICAL